MSCGSWVYRGRCLRGDSFTAIGLSYLLITIVVIADWKMNALLRLARPVAGKVFSHPSAAGALPAVHKTAFRGIASSAAGLMKPHMNIGTIG